ncbi:transcription factor Adf-1 [Papilio machaon]|uniref:transcription factor Adf-1 n=1 Tax=Papilio machaon TaxID=76193 RepID=UPI001E663315|nr:transcription factor Adf-1 [Papilio machaon]
MAKRKINFNAQTVTRFIERIESRPCLWDVDYEHYNDRHKMIAAWQEISNDMDIPVDTLRLKWKSLRDFFIRMLRMGNIKDVREYKGGWQHFQKMWFLNKAVSTRNRAYSSEEAASRSFANSDDEATIEEGEVMVKCEPVQMEQEEVFVSDYDPSPPKKRCSTSDDFDEMFLKSLTPFFKNLEPVRKLIVRNKIQELLIEEITAQTTGNIKLKN